MTRPRHTGKETEKVIADAERSGWRVVYPMGHWGYLYCPGGCRVRISGTPQDDGSHARRLARLVARCPHLSGEKGEGSDEVGSGD